MAAHVAFVAGTTAGFIHRGACCCGVSAPGGGSMLTSRWNDVTVGPHIVSVTQPASASVAGNQSGRWHLLRAGLGWMVQGLRQIRDERGTRQTLRWNAHSRSTAGRDQIGTDYQIARCLLESRRTVRFRLMVGGSVKPRPPKKRAGRCWERSENRLFGGLAVCEGFRPLRVDLYQVGVGIP